MNGRCLIALLALLATLALPGATHGSEAYMFQDNFNGKLGDGWSWRRENPKTWRVRDNALEIRIEPGNMWGPQNDGKNILLRPAPEQKERVIEFSCIVSNSPTEQYEQVDLVWYYSDSYMVKLGLELVDGKLSIVMGREENDRARTIALIGNDLRRVQLRLRVQDGIIQGSYRSPNSSQWQIAGECDLPVLQNAKPQIAIMTYQGGAKVEHWARIEQFELTVTAPQTK